MIRYSALFGAAAGEDLLWGRMCWGDGYDEDTCCFPLEKGGNPECWTSPHFQFKGCCIRDLYHDKFGSCSQPFSRLPVKLWSATSKVDADQRVFSPAELNTLQDFETSVSFETRFRYTSALMLKHWSVASSPVIIDHAEEAPGYQLISFGVLFDQLDSKGVYVMHGLDDYVRFGFDREGSHCKASKPPRTKHRVRDVILKWASALTLGGQGTKQLDHFPLHEDVRFIRVFRGGAMIGKSEPEVDDIKKGISCKNESVPYLWPLLYSSDRVFVKDVDADGMRVIASWMRQLLDENCDVDPIPVEVDWISCSAGRCIIGGHIPPDKPSPVDLQLNVQLPWHRTNDILDVQSPIIDLMRLFRPCTDCHLVRHGGYMLCAYKKSETVHAIYSYGIETEDAFGESMELYQYDCTIDNSPGPPGAKFSKECVDGRPISESPKPYSTVRQNLERNGHLGLPEGSLILKMDVEGAEYGAMADLTRSELRLFRQMAFEFHALTSDPEWIELKTRAVQNILDAGFSVIHVHGENMFLKQSISSCSNASIVQEFPLRVEVTFALLDHPSHQFLPPACRERQYLLPEDESGFPWLQQEDVVFPNREGC